MGNYDDFTTDDLEREIDGYKAEVKRLMAENDINDRFAAKVTKESNRLREALEPCRKLLIAMKQNGSSHSYFFLQQAWGEDLGWEDVMKIIGKTLKALKEKR